MTVAWIAILTILGIGLALLLYILFFPLYYSATFAYCKGLHGHATIKGGPLYSLRAELLETPPILHIYILGMHFERQLVKKPSAEAVQEAEITADQPELLSEGTTVKEPEPLIETREKRPPEYKPTIKERILDALEVGHFWMDTRLFREIWALLRDLVHIANPDRLEISGRVGLSNPEHTGYMLMLTMPFFRPDRRFQIDIEPIWDQEVVELKLFGLGRTRIYKFIYRLICFALNEKIRRKYHEYRAFEKRRAERQAERLVQAAAASCDE